MLLKRLTDARQSEMLALRLSNLSSQGIHFWISNTHREAGGQHFAEHDLRTKTASDLSAARAQELLDHASPTIAHPVYQCVPIKVRPVR